METESIYSNREYLSRNKDWHQIDSHYKASLVIHSLQRSKLKFTTAVDWGCGAGEVTRILSEKYPNTTFTGIDISKDARMFWQNKRRNNLS